MVKKHKGTHNLAQRFLRRYTSLFWIPKGAKKRTLIEATCIVQAMLTSGKMGMKLQDPSACTCPVQFRKEII